MLRRILYLAQMLRNGSRSAESLAARQADDVRSLVRHAAMHVPFYRDLYAAQGISADAINDVSDLAVLPIVTKQQLRAAGNEAVSRHAPARRVTISTSGSSGEPFTFSIDHTYDQWRKAQYLRAYLGGGRRLSDKVLRLTAFPQRRVPWISHLGLMREHQISCASDPAQVADAWQALVPDVLQGYPSSLRSLANHCRDRGRALQPAPRLVFTDSELLTPDTRALLEQQFAAPVLDVFGTYETDNIAFQCPARGGYHIATDCAVIEIVRDGRPVPPGEPGEIVVTVLANRTTPFIRYNLRDLGRLLPQPCECGLPFPLLSGLHGRADDLIVLAGGRQRTAMDVLGRLDHSEASVRHYQLRQLHLGVFELLVVPASGFMAADGQRLASAIAATLGNAQVTVRTIDAIPPERSGKLRAFVSHLARDSSA
jgi:phenylacetate-CoA ligase